MLKRSNLALLSIAMLLALATAFAVSQQLTKVEANRTSEATVSVVVVAKEIDPHTVVSADDVKLEKVPASTATAGVAKQLSDVVGKYSASQWFPGQIVLTQMVTDSSQPAAFPLKIPQGYRAYTMANDAVTGVDHLVSVGDHVDVIVTSSQPKLTRVILQNILVLNVDNAPAAEPSKVMVNGTTSTSSNNTSSSNASSKTVDTLTLAIRPEDLTLIDYSKTFGQLHIALRNPHDTDTPTLHDAFNVFAQVK